MLVFLAFTDVMTLKFLGKTMKPEKYWQTATPFALSAQQRISESLSQMWTLCEEAPDERHPLSLSQPSCSQKPNHSS